MVLTREVSQVMHIAIRADASTEIGAGHIMRCLALAEELKERGAEVFFICRELEGNLCAQIVAQQFKLHRLPATILSEKDWHLDAEQTIAACTNSYSRIDWIVVDHYHLDAKWESSVRDVAHKVMVIDDLANRNHSCDALLDQNYLPGCENRYATLVPSSCHILLGSKYALLRHEFKSIRKHLEFRIPGLKKILVFFTAGDDKGETIKAMQGIQMFGNIEQVDVVIGQSNLNNKEINQICDKLHWGLHCNINYMPKLIAQADLAIGAGGSSNWERCALGVPAIVTILADNQEPIAEALGRAGVVFNLGWSGNLKAQDYANALSTLSHDRLKDMSEKALAIVDARGSERMADILLAA